MFTLNYKDSRPIYEQVKDSIRRAIISGVLATGDKIPSVRETAGELAVNPNTIQRAYHELEAEGYICSVPGKGSFVSESDEALQGRREELFIKLDKTLAELGQLGVDTDEVCRHVKAREAKL